MECQTAFKLCQHIKPGIEIKPVGHLTLRFGALDYGVVMRRGCRLALEAEADCCQHNIFQQTVEIVSRTKLQQ